MRISVQVRRLAVGAALVVALLQAGGLQPASAQQAEPVRLTLWMTDSRASYKTFLEKYAAAYRKENPNVTIQIVQMAPADAYIKWPASVAAGNTPDITWMFFAFAAWLDALPGGGFVPMDDLVAELGRDKFSEPALQGWQYHGRTLCAPVARTPSFLFYRKDLFAAAGFAEPKTWSDVVAAAKALHQPGQGQYGIALAGKGDWALRLNYGVILYSNGGSVIDRDGRVQIDTPEGIRAIEIYQELFKYTPPGSLNAAFVETARAFAQGATAMVISNPAVMTQFLHANPDKKGQIGAVIPSDVGRNDTVQNYRGWCVFRNSKHPEEAKRFIRFLFRTPAYADYLEAAVVSSFAVYNDKEAIEEFLRRDETSRAFPDAARRIQSIDRGLYPGVDRYGQNPKAGMIGNEAIIERHLNRMLAEKGDARQTARLIQAELAELMKR